MKWRLSEWLGWNDKEARHEQLKTEGWYSLLINAAWVTGLVVVVWLLVS